MALEDPTERGADVGHRVEQRRVRLVVLAAEELEYRDDLGARQDGKAERGLHADVDGGLRARKIRVLGDVHDPGRASGGQHPPRQAHAALEARAVGHRLEVTEALGLL